MFRVRLLAGLGNAVAAALDCCWVDFGRLPIILTPERMKLGRGHAVPTSPLLMQQPEITPRVPGEINIKDMDGLSPSSPN